MRRLLLLLGLCSLTLTGCDGCGRHASDPSATSPEPEPSAQGDAPTGYVRLASGLDPVHTLNRWLLLHQAGEDEGVRLAPYLGQDTTLVVAAADARAEELARRFGATPAPLEVAEDTLRRPSLVQTSGATAVYAEPGDAAPTRMVPAHAILIRLDGGLPAAPEGGDFAWVAVTRTEGGYVRAAALSSYDGCVPSADRFLADLPVSDGHSHEVRATVSRVRASFGGGVVDAFLFASQDRHEDEEEEDEEDEDIEGKHGAGVGLYPANERCELSPGFALSFGHVAEQVDVLDGGDGASLLSVVLSEGDEELEQKLYRVGVSEPLRERELDVHTQGPWEPLTLEPSRP